MTYAPSQHLMPVVSGFIKELSIIKSKISSVICCAASLAHEDHISNSILIRTWEVEAMPAKSALLLLHIQVYIFGSSRVHELSSCRVTSSFSSSRVVELFLGFVPFPVPSSRFPVKYGATLFRPKSHGSKKGVGLIFCRDVEKAY